MTVMRLVFAMALLCGVAFAGNFLSERSKGAPIHADNKGKNQDLYCSACLIFTSKMLMHMNESELFSQPTRFSSKVRQRFFQQASDAAVEAIKKEDHSIVFALEDGRHFTSRANPDRRMVALEADASDANRLLCEEYAESFRKRHENIYQLTSHSAVVRESTQNWASLACGNAFKACVDMIQFLGDQ